MEKLLLSRISAVTLVVALFTCSVLIAEDLVIEEMTDSATKEKVSTESITEKKKPADDSKKSNKDADSVVPAKADSVAPAKADSVAPAKVDSPTLDKTNPSSPDKKIEKIETSFPSTFFVAPVTDASHTFNPQILTIATTLFTQELNTNTLTTVKEQSKDGATIQVVIGTQEEKQIMTATIVYEGKEFVTLQSASFSGMGEIKQALLLFAKQTAETILKKKPKEKVSPPLVVAPVVVPIQKSKPKPKTEVKTPQKPEKKQDIAQKDDKKEEPKKKKFRKGKLANVGSNYIVSPFNRAVLAIGMTKIKEDYYLTIDPRLSLNLHKIDLLMGFHLPFNIQMFSTDFTSGDDGQFKLRSEDWDEWQDYLRVIQYIEYGSSEDNLYISLGSNFAQTLGHGTIMKNYIPNLDPTTSTLSARLNYYNDYIGFETIFGDIGKGNMFGGLFFVKPLSIFLDGYHAKSLSFGFSFMADRNAPTQLEYVSYANMPDPNSPDWDAMNDRLATAGLAPRHRRVASDKHGRPIVESDQFLYFMGLDAEFKLYKNEYVDIKTFVDYSWMGSTMKQGGFTAGLLNRFNFDKARKHAMRFQFEYRYAQNGYLPAFFDTYYDVERHEMISNIYGVDNFSPDAHSKHWHAQNENMSFSSYSWELSYSFAEWIIISAGMEYYPNSYSWFAHLELPDLWIVSALLTYMQKGIKYGTPLGEDFQFNAMLKGVIRFQVLPIMFIDAYASRTDMFWTEEIPRKDDNYRGHYVAAWQWGFDIEIGWEWGNRTAEKKKEEK